MKYKRITRFNLLKFFNKRGFVFFNIVKIRYYSSENDRVVKRKQDKVFRMA